MKICICGSMRHFEAMFDWGERLKKLGHEVVMPDQIIAKSFGTREDISKHLQKSGNYMHFDRINASDSIVVVNPGGRIGASTFAEIAVFIALSHFKGQEKKVMCTDDWNVEENSDKLDELNAWPMVKL